MGHADCEYFANELLRLKVNDSHQKDLIKNLHMQVKNLEYEEAIDTLSILEDATL